MFASLFGAACSRAETDVKSFPAPAQDIAHAADAAPQTMVLAGGCFWCTEGVFENIPGVLDVVSGYAGDEAAKAVYELVGGGATKHAEVIQISYDPRLTSYGQLLKIFFSIAHDPTQKNRQGPDVGLQYRSAIFYANDEQRRVAEAYIAQLNAAKVFSRPIETTVEPLEAFYRAEEYHQDYARQNLQSPYIQQQAMPKVNKARQFAADHPAATQPSTSPATRPTE